MIQINSKKYYSINFKLMQKNDLTVKVAFLKREQSMHCNQEDNNHFLIYMVKKKLKFNFKNTYNLKKSCSV